MAPRLDLQEIFETLCENVYFQPPASVQMKYPAIVYERSSANTEYADNIPYRQVLEYDVKLISRNPDEPIRQGLMKIPMSRYERFFVADNLNHDVFTIHH